MTQTEKMNKELVLAGLFDKDSDYDGMIGKSVQELLDVFSKQGHSGFSAQYVANIFRRLVSSETLTPLTGEDNEWVDVTEEMGKKIFQNNRCSAVFKEEDGKAYYLNAIVWQGEDSNDTFTGAIDDIRSRQYFDFPFVQKTFYVDVMKLDYDKSGDKDYFTDKDGRKYVYTIKDRKQLDEVFEYYNK